MEKEIVREAVAIVMLNENGKTLFLLRAKHKKTFPSMWSLPSYFTKENETLKDTCKRIGLEKLGCEIEPVKLLEKDKFKRENYILEMNLFLVRLENGTPKITTPSYDDLKWEEGVKQLNSMDEFGACTTLYKEYLSKN